VFHNLILIRHVTSHRNITTSFSPDARSPHSVEVNPDLRSWWTMCVRRLAPCGSNWASWDGPMPASLMYPSHHHAYTCFWGLC